MIALPSPTLFAEASKDSGGGILCMVVGGMILLTIIFAFMDKPIRCARCGFRAKKSRFQGGRCPKCDSYEM
ncbi:MAG: hypothetical protein ACREJC_20925 [Tepidisphaeraceae bacterium]